jgi:ATP adenylyltransferase
VLCTAAANPTHDEENFLLYRGVHVYALLNIFPYTGGHLMIAPYAHIPDLTSATPETMAELAVLTRKAEEVLRGAYGAPGYNIGMNIGSCAGAGVAGHIHMHVLPRWPGDVNFMTAIGETRVLPEDLRTSYQKLRPRFHT